MAGVAIQPIKNQVSAVPEKSEGGGAVKMAVIFRYLIWVPPMQYLYFFLFYFFFFLFFPFQKIK